MKKVVANEQISVSEESLAVVALLHDVCKANTYKVDYRNVKRDGEWVKEPYFTIDDPLPYGHGEKSVYIISGFMRLTREEAMAINWHMAGFDPRCQVSSDLADAFTMFPTAVQFGE